MRGNIDRAADAPFPAEGFSSVLRGHPGPKTALAVSFNSADPMILHTILFL